MHTVDTLPSKSELVELWSYLNEQERVEMDALLTDIPTPDDWHHLARLREPHEKQRLFLDSRAKRKVIRAGRRGGKTVGIAILAIRAFMAGRRVLYGAPTEDQVETFWWEVKTALQDAIDASLLYKNETKHVVELPGTKTRIRAKTAWNADTLRGDYADLLILDEFQMMSEDAWTLVGAPMLLDNNGDAVFIYTPPSLHSVSRSKARDPRFASKLFKRAQSDDTGRWASFHFTSHDNPHNSREALAEITQDMTALAVEQEIMAEDKDEAPGALWTRTLLEHAHVHEVPDLVRVVVGVDPPGGVTECGIVVAGLDRNGHGYVLEDASLQATPEKWSTAAVDAYFRHLADRIVAEKNFGGDMVERTIRTAERGSEVSFKAVTATRGKAVRAEPVVALYERGRVHHVGSFARLEDELCTWQPAAGIPSPNRLDAMVWALTELMLGGSGEIQVGSAPPALQDFFGGWD